MRQPKPVHFSLALLCFALGIYPLAISLGLLQVDDAHIRVPMWVLALIGAVVLVAGLMILMVNHSRTTDLLASVTCLLLGVIGAWVALFGASEGFAGGIPLLSQEMNSEIARWVFGCGALLCFSISLYAFRRSRGLSRKTEYRSHGESR
jgi:hypothetical protein